MKKILLIFSLMFILNISIAAAYSMPRHWYWTNSTDVFDIFFDCRNIQYIDIQDTKYISVWIKERHRNWATLQDEKTLPNVAVSDYYLLHWYINPNDITYFYADEFKTFDEDGNLLDDNKYKEMKCNVVSKDSIAAHIVSTVVDYVASHH